MRSKRKSTLLLVELYKIVGRIETGRRKEGKNGAEVKKIEDPDENAVRKDKL